VQVDWALQNISSRVDELALQPQVHTAALQQELSALAAGQKALQVPVCPAAGSPGPCRPPPLQAALPSSPVSSLGDAIACS